MNEFISGETLIRLSLFFGVLSLMLGWEHWQPRRPLIASVKVRWFSNLGIAALNQLLIRALFPIVVMGAALHAQTRGWGLFNSFDTLPWIAIIGSIALLDLVIYLQHRAFHAIPPFWRLHRMHHADVDFDTTTGVRFHPLEAIASMVIKIAAIVCLGAPAVAVLAFEVILNATSLFNHGNVRIPPGLDRVLRWFVVTPDMHRVHHSIETRELNRNFGFNLPWWDHLFSTYQDQPEAGHEKMQIGLTTFRSGGDLRLDRMLVQPFLDTESTP